MREGLQEGRVRGRADQVPRLHVVTDDAILARDDWSAAAARVFEVGGPAMALHLRGPTTDGATIFALTQALLPEARRADAWIVVNDRVDVVLTTGATGVQLGGRSLPVPVARAILGEDRCIGASVHAAHEVAEVGLQGADFAFLGTIFSTPSHEGLPGMGLNGLRDAVPSAEGMPLIGIGGIGVMQASAVIDTGAHGVAVMRGVWDHPDPAAAVGAYMQAIEDAIR